MVSSYAESFPGKSQIDETNFRRIVVRSMTRGVVLAVIAATSLSHIARAQAGERTLMHTFQEGSRIVYVTIVDRSSGPLGLVSSEDPSSKERWFTISRSQFNDMRRTLMSSGAQKYAGDEKSDRRFDAVNYYVFSAAEMPHDWKKNYAVPSDNASRTLIALAKQFRGYAK
jgi:hypothetical protein